MGSSPSDFEHRATVLLMLLLCEIGSQMTAKTPTRILPSVIELELGLPRPLNVGHLPPQHETERH